MSSRFNWCVISINATFKKYSQRECSEDEEDDPESVVDSSFKFLHSDDNNEEDNSTDVDEFELVKDTVVIVSEEIDIENGENIIQHPVGKGSSSSSSSKKSSSSGSSAKTQIEVGRKDDTDEDVALGCDRKTEHTKEMENKDTKEEQVETYDVENENRWNQMESKSSSSSSGTSTPRSKSSAKEYIPPSLRNIFTPLSSDEQNTGKNSVEEEVFETIPEPDRSDYHKSSLDTYESEKESDEISSGKAQGPVSGRSTPSSGLKGESRRRKSTSSNSSSSNCSGTPKRRESHGKPPIPPESQTGKYSRSSKPDSRRASSSSDSELSSGKFPRKKGRDQSGSLSNNRSPTGSRPSAGYAGNAAGLEKIKAALQKALDSTTSAGRGSSVSREKSKSGSRRSSIGNGDGQVSSKKMASNDIPSLFSVERYMSAKVVTHTQQSTVEPKDDFVEEEVRTFYQCLDVHFTFGCSLRDDDHLSILLES